MSKRKGKGSTPASRGGNQLQTLQNQKTAKTIQDFQHQVNSSMAKIDARLKNIEAQVGSAYDLINAHINGTKLSAPTQEKFFKFIQDKMGMKFSEMDADIKLNALLQWLEATSVIPESVYTKLVYEEFDKRNDLVTLAPGEKPQMGQLAMIAWRFEYQGQILAGSRKATLYNIGCNELLVDEHLLNMKPGEQQKFDVTFPSTTNNNVLKGKSGIMHVGLLSFKKQTDGNKIAPEKKMVNLSPEEKLKVWKENYRSITIE